MAERGGVTTDPPDCLESGCQFLCGGIQLNPIGLI